jgi:HlyD family secretion protein
MIRSRNFNRIALAALVAVPLGVIGILTTTVLLPALKNPEGKFYTSELGYPAMQRKTGKPIQVQTVTVGSKAVTEGLAAPGESVALQEVGVRPQVAGPIEQVHVVEGQWIRQGEPLLSIQKQPFENAVDTARNNIGISEATLKALQKSAAEQLAELQDTRNSLRDRMTIAQNKLQQSNSLAEAGAISQFQLYDNQDTYLSRQRDLSMTERDMVRTRNDLQKQIEAVRLQLRNNQLALNNALRDLKNATIYASNDAMVSRVNIHSGELADPRDRNPVLTLTQNVVFKAYIDQARLNSIQVGDQATVRLSAYPGRLFQGRVIRLNPTVETEGTRSNRVGTNRQYTYSAWVQVEDLQMPPGLQGYVQFGEEKSSLVVPERAITHLSAGEGMVMVANGGQAVVKQVKLGRVANSQREVLAGLVPGEEVILSPRALIPGDHLQSKSK